MRRVTTPDLIAAARVLLGLPEAQRAAAMAALIARAAMADRHRLATGRQHPAYGNGSLMAAALAHPSAAPGCDDEAAYLACLACAIEGVLAWRAEGPR